MALSIAKKLRREQILKTSLIMAQESGLSSVSVFSVAMRCDCHPSTVKAIFPNKEQLLKALFAYAKEIGDESTVKLGERLFSG
jgi:hypothetical protein